MSTDNQNENSQSNNEEPPENVDVVDDFVESDFVNDHGGPVVDPEIFGEPIPEDTPTSEFQGSEGDGVEVIDDFEEADFVNDDGGPEVDSEIFGEPPEGYTPPPELQEVEEEYDDGLDNYDPSSTELDDEFSGAEDESTDTTLEDSINEYDPTTTEDNDSDDSDDSDLDDEFEGALGDDEFSGAEGDDLATPTSELQGASDDSGEELDFMGEFDPMPTHDDEEQLDSAPGFEDADDLNNDEFMGGIDDSTQNGDNIDEIPGFEEDEDSSDSEFEGGINMED